MELALIRFANNGHVVDEKIWLQGGPAVCICGQPSSVWGAEFDLKAGACYAEERMKELEAKKGFWKNPGI